MQIQIKLILIFHPRILKSKNRMKLMSKYISVMKVEKNLLNV